MTVRPPSKPPEAPGLPPLLAAADEVAEVRGALARARVRLAHADGDRRFWAEMREGLVRDVGRTEEAARTGPGEDPARDEALLAWRRDLVARIAVAERERGRAQERVRRAVGVVVELEGRVEAAQRRLEAATGGGARGEG